MMEHLSTIEQRKKLRLLKDRRKAQRKLIYDAYVKPLDDNLKLLDKAISGETSVQHYIASSIALNKYLIELIGGGTNGSKRRR